ncbi:helix-turn-helix transcriptional regulator [Marivirga sp. S37H4]|uniref:Helix-turn-helix transcriptional regulator n=1 Tax=Marivirga aurantiaca TaxID=2802615 RepID=A0A934WWS7_9BACT|nr:AraC family transcriptional regulator [Marivirga aurantiaca]MBK6264352.1 helix-turn-helix transcriptional regulator [Marivirga aurantiaca]
MINKISKIGFSKIGGIFIGKDIVSDFHKHYALTVIVSFGKLFSLYTSKDNQDDYQAVLIQKNIDFSIETCKNEYVAFIHIVPYSEAGMRLTDNAHPILKLDSLKLQDSLSLIKDWFYSNVNTQEIVENILDAISLITGACKEKKVMDDRILKAMTLIMDSEDEKLHVDKISVAVNLSISHFNRLFKKETGLTFRRFVLHSKLIKSIFAVYENNNLTEASFIGGFSDQPHLTRTFKENFGIKPSTILK